MITAAIMLARESGPVDFRIFGKECPGKPRLEKGFTMATEKTSGGRLKGVATKANNWRIKANALKLRRF